MAAPPFNCMCLLKKILWNLLLLLQGKKSSIVKNINNTKKIKLYEKNNFIYAHIA
jgi:hypothetical protein